MKKILFIVPLPPPIHGASLRNKSLVESDVLNSAFTIKVIPIQFVSDNQDMGVFSLKKVIKAFSLFFTTLSRLITFKPNLVYINMATFGFALYRDAIVILISKIFCKRVTIHIRTQKINEQSEQSKLKKWLFKTVFKNSNIICLSKNLSLDLRNVFKGPIKIINNGIELFDTEGIQIQKPKSSIRFLFLSNLLKTKGVFDLVDAVSLLKEKNHQFDVVIVGKDAELTTSEISNYVIEKGVESFIEIKGAAYNDEKIIEFLNADVFVFPTHFEAFPGVVLEAMQLGLPVISTNEGAIPEIVDHMQNGIIIDKGNIIQLAEAMEFFITNQNEISIFSKNAQEKFANYYTIEKFENNMKLAFEEALTNN